MTAIASILLTHTQREQSAWSTYTFCQFLTFLVITLVVTIVSADNWPDKCRKEKRISYKNPYKKHFASVSYVTFSFHAENQSGHMLRSRTVGKVKTLKSAKMTKQSGYAFVPGGSVRRYRLRSY